MQLMGENIFKVIDVLGKPIDIASKKGLGGVYIYDRLYFHVGENSLRFSIGVEPDLCEIDGISLDKSREDLISILGTPKSERFDDTGEYAYVYLLDFEIQGWIVRFCLSPSDGKADGMEVF